MIEIHADLTWMLHFQNDLLSEVLQKIGEDGGREGNQKQHFRTTKRDGENMKI